MKFKTKKKLKDNDKVLPKGSIFYDWDKTKDGKDTIYVSHSIERNEIWTINLEGIKNDPKTFEEIK